MDQSSSSNQSFSMIFSGFCAEYDPFWDPDRTWNTEDPNFTSCFRKTALIWVPCSFFWLFLPLEIYQLYHSKKRNIPLKTLGIVKALSALILVFVSIVDLVYWGLQSNLYPVEIVDPILRGLTFSAVLCLLFAERARGKRISGLQWTFFFLYFILSLIDFYGHVRQMTLTWNLTLPNCTFLLTLFFVFISFICHFFVEAEPRYGDAASLTVSHKRPCPMLSASFPSRLTFTWLDQLTWTGFKRDLLSSDIWDLAPFISSKFVFPKFNFHLLKAVGKAKKNREIKSGKNEQSGIEFDKKTESVEVKVEGTKSESNKAKFSIFPVLVKTYGPHVLTAAFYKLINDSLTFIPPILLKRIINFARNEEELWKGVLYTLLLFLSATMTSIFLSKFFFEMYVCGMWIKTSLTSAIYRKALRVPTTAKKDITTGEIVNLMSVDVQRIVDLMPYINTVWSGPFQIFVAIYFLWNTLGPSVLAGVFFMILLIPINGVIAAKNRRLQVLQMKEKDERVKIMNEILQGIKILKLYAWEQGFADIIYKIRNKEVQIMKRIGYLSAGSAFIWTCAPFMVSLVTFASYVLSSSENVLDSEKAFVCLALFNILRFPLSMLPMIIGSIVQASVSIKRINAFMNTDELDEDAVQKIKEQRKKEESTCAISLEKASFRWGGGDLNAPPTLKELSLEIKRGSLVAVVGTVGSGKSSLLSAILGEMEKIGGSITVSGKSVAYVAQQAWIQNATVMENVLFNKPYDEDKYRQALQACSLESDLEILPAGDKTEIGEKGINLSGGQKQRVSLARALYSDADVYLLDDPLSAVDSHVGRHIYDNVISNTSGVLKDKTRIIVTHGVTYLPYVDRIVVLKNGEISEVGTYKELLEQKGDFADFIVQFLAEVEDEDNRDDLDVVDPELKNDIEKNIGKQELQKQISAKKRKPRRTTSVSSDSNASHKSDDGHEVKSKTKDKQYEEEKTETGKVEWSVYLHYFRKMSLPFVLTCISGLILHQTLSTMSTVLLAWWSDEVTEVEAAQNVTHADILQVQTYYLSIYGLYGLGQAITVVIGFLFLCLACLEGAKQLHHNMLINILKSPMSFFDTTPQGRILNRFGKDVDVLDTAMPMVLRGWISCLLGVVSSLLVITVTTPIFILPISVIVVCYYVIQRIYVATSRQLKRIESISRSPIYSHFNETINGAATIRAYDLQNAFIAESERKIDENQKAAFPATVSNRWLAVRLEFVGNLIVFSAALLAVLGRDTLSPGLVGLSVSYALTITSTLNWLVRMASEVETNIVAVERIMEYSSSPQEAEWENKDITLPNSWPQKGDISIRNYSTRYRPGLDLILKDVSVEIKGGEKIGIVGRTGAGKSSLTLSLFRVIEAVKGQIIIDGYDISKLGLHQLRSRITVIPQDPVLFSGTMRMNLDPLNLFSDTDIWTALEHSHLKSFVSSLTDGLDFVVAEGGENLSTGQRQLICLARALLRKTKVLILDEATAAVDLETDELIQTTIRKEFKDSTVLTIAHRLNTIMDYTKILVFRSGEKVEFDSPTDLLKDKKSLFYSMCKDAGLV